MESDILDDGVIHTRMIERAIRQRWPIPDNFREALVNRQIRIAIDPGSNAREATSAFRAIVHADEINRESQSPSQTNVQVNVGVNANITAADIIRQAIKDGTIGQLAETGYRRVESSKLCADCKPQQVGDGSASEGDGSGVSGDA